MVSLVRALCILVLLSSLTLQAGDNLNLAISSLRHQVNIIHFATHDELFASHLDTLDNEPAIGQLQPIINDVRMFWQSQQIPYVIDQQTLMNHQLIPYSAKCLVVSQH